MSTIKNCVLIGVICGDKILVAVDQLQGYEVLDLLGGVIADNESSLEASQRALTGHLADSYTLVPHGHFTSFISKPEGLVELKADTFLVKVHGPSEVLSNSNRPTIWLTRSELYSDPRNRRNNKLFDKFFDDKPLDLEIHEDQFGLWIDAKITNWIAK